MVENHFVSPGVFSLSGLGLKFNTAADTDIYVEELLTQPDIVTDVVLSGNTIGIEAGKSFAGAFSQLSNIERVILSDVFTGRLKEEIPLALTAMIESLHDKEHLKELDLSDNAFGPAGAECFVSILVNNPHLQILRVNNNGLGIGGGKCIAKALQQSLEMNSKLSLNTLMCGRNRLENVGAIALSETFLKFDTLKQLIMPQNGIRSEGIEAILTSIKKHEQLEVLDLTDNTFTERGGVALSLTLPSLSCLRELYVGDCLIEDVAGEKIAKAFQLPHVCPLLTVLDMSFNELKDCTLKAFISPLRSHLKNRVLKLELNGNMFSSAAMVELRDSLETHPSILGSLSENEDEEEEEDYEESEESESSDGEDELSEKEESEDGDLSSGEEKQKSPVGSNEGSAQNIPKKENHIVSPVKSTLKEDTDVSNLADFMDKSLHVKPTTQQ